MGNVGIGTINPFAKLQVVSASTPYNLDSGLIVAQVAATAKRIALGYDTTIDSGYIQSVDSGSGSRPLLLNANNGFVGIGKTNPTATLDVNGTIRFGAAAMSPAAGKVLTSDASGNATWQAFTSGGVGPQGPAGPTGPQGPAGSVRTVTCTAGSYVSSVDASGNAICRTGFSSASNIYQVQSSDVALLGGSWGTINVSCNAGDKVIGGGLKCTQAETLPTISAFPSDSSTLTCMWNGGAGYHCTKCIAICAH